MNSECSSSHGEGAASPLDAACSCCAPAIEGADRVGRGDPQSRTGDWELWSLAAAAGLLITGFLVPAKLEPWIFGTAVILGGVRLLPRAWRSARAGSADMYVLMVLAVIGAILIGELAEAATIVVLFAGAQYLERRAMARARHAIGELVQGMPEQVVAADPAGDRLIGRDQVAAGMLIRVAPGQRVPVDGNIVEGWSALDQSPLTGESIPVDRLPGDPVLAGSVNGEGALLVRATCSADATVLAGVERAVARAQSSRARIQRLVDRFAAGYTPAVLALAVLLAVAPPLWGGGEWLTWIYRGLTLLVVACPCALVLATPITLVSGLTGAARDGILVRDGEELERLAAVDVMAFDKTGTLSEGHPVLTDVVSLGEISSDTLLGIAAGLERESRHPVAAAVRQAATDRGLPPVNAVDHRALPGRGASARVDGEELFAGNRRICCDELRLCNTDLHQALESLEDDGKTAVLLASRQSPLGLLAVRDTIRPSARVALSRLRGLGIEKLVLISGDNEVAASRVAQELAMDSWHARLLPEDKAVVVAAMTAAGQRVAYVGDGINDGPALAGAHLGIALGARGSGVALETAGVALMRDDLTLIPTAVERARRVIHLIRQNFVLAVGLKLLFVVLAVFGQATLWMAVLADTGASLLVIANGLRALGPQSTTYRQIAS